MTHELPGEPYLPKQRAAAVKEILDKAMAGDPEAIAKLKENVTDGFSWHHDLLDHAYQGNAAFFPIGYHATVFGENDMDFETRPNVIKRGMKIPMSFEQVAGIKAPKGHYIQRVPTWAQRVHYLGVKIFFRFAERVIERLDRTPWVSGPGGYEYDPPFLHDFAPRKKFIREEEA